MPAISVQTFCWSGCQPRLYEDGITREPFAGVARSNKHVQTACWSGCQPRLVQGLNNALW